MLRSLLKDKTLLREEVFINGEFQNAAKLFVGRQALQNIPVVNPSTGETLGNVPNVDKEATLSAISAAHQAFSTVATNSTNSTNSTLSGWKHKLAKERAAVLRKWHDLMHENKEDLAIIMHHEQGKPLTEARGEIDYAASFLSWFAEEATRVYGDVIPPDANGRRILVTREPVGVCAAITPWNFPSAMITRKVAPAIAAGCTVVVKPSELTPFSAIALAVLAERAGLPKGVFNVITGNAEMIGKTLCHNKLVRKVGFTGSTAVGKILYSQCADTIKKLSLELGGNAPFIVFEDADIDVAVENLMKSKFRNGGQTCVTTNRVYVHSSIHSLFVNKIEGRITSAPKQSLITSRSADKVQSQIIDAVEKGAKLLAGGNRLPNNVVEPALLINCKSNMKIANEETFGPVIGIFSFDDEAEVIKAANNVDVGLAAYMFTKDTARLFRVSEQLEYGMVGVNEGLVSSTVAPFGGVKQSGIDREGSKYGILPFTEIKYTCLGNIQ